LRPRRALQIGSLAMAGVCACVAAGAAFAPADPPERIDDVAFEGRTVKFEGAPAHGFTRWFRFGPWQYGARGSEARPNDKNPNLYIVVPGSEHHSDAMPQFDHTAIISTLAKQEEANWDVYWAIVLDPDLTQDLRDERELLIEAQKTFTPRENFQLSDVPGREVLMRHLKVENVADLERFRRNDGHLPRIAIVPARISVRATVTDPADTSAQK
jgi:hypothetical protein